MPRAISFFFFPCLFSFLLLGGGDARGTLRKEQCMESACLTPATGKALFTVAGGKEH